MNICLCFLVLLTATAGSCFLGRAQLCVGRCLQQYDGALSCQCNTECEQHHNCCSDYYNRCKYAVVTDGGSTATGGIHVPVTTPSVQSVTSSNIADKLWQVDPDRFSTSDITLNIGGHTSGGSGSDVSPNRLFTKVNTAKFSRPIYKALFALYDNYTPTRGVAEHFSVVDLAEINRFLDLVIQSPVMDVTYNYLTSHHIFRGDRIAFRQKLYSLWFEPYSRSGGSSRDSSGFEHVFVGEYKSSIVEGFHNWVRMYKEELAGHLNYLGYMKQVGPQLLEFTFTWNGHHKNIDSCVFGSSPVFDMALDTICILTRPSSTCPFSLNGHRFSIKQYDEAHTSGLQIATAYTVF